MPRSTQPTQAQILAVMRHLADVASLKENPPAQRQLLVDGLNKLLDTDGGFFYVADDWRPDARPHFIHHTLCTENDQSFLRYTAEFGVKYPLEHDPYCYHSIRDPATVQAWTFDDVTADGDPASRDNFMDLAATVRLRDGVVSFYRTGPSLDRVVGFGLHRFGRATPLSAREVNLAQIAVNEIRRLVERGHLILPAAAGDVPAALSPRLQQVLDRLLAGDTPKTIARELGLSIWTVREHIRRLYTHFNVCGREALMARFTR